VQTGKKQPLVLGENVAGGKAEHAGHVRGEHEREHAQEAGAQACRHVARQLQLLRRKDARQLRAAHRLGRQKFVGREVRVERRGDFHACTSHGCFQ